MFLGTGPHPARMCWVPTPWPWAGQSPGCSAPPLTSLHVCWQVDDQIHACYAQTMSEWLGCEAIVRQRERESHAAALAKCSSGASLDSHLHRMLHRDSTVSNEVMDSWPGRLLVGGGQSLGTASPLALWGRGNFRIRSGMEEVWI